VKPFRIACCQLEAHDIEDAEANLQGMLRALEEAGAAGAQLVLLPECSYPAYYLKDARPYERPGVRPFAEVTDLLSERARRYGYWLAAGVAVPHDDGTVTNSGLVFDAAGELRGRYDKSFLWHFDNSWFTPGHEFPVWDAGFARFGVLICADGRLPEIARSLAVNGAEVICDLTAWVSWARTPEALSTTQCDYLMPARAYENSAWVAAADKWGTEDGTIVYAGNSCVIDPAGAIRAQAAAVGDAVLVYDIVPGPLPELPQRRPSLYGGLTRPTAGLPAVRLEEEAIVPGRASGRVSVVPSNGGFDAAETAARFAALRAQGADLVVFGGTEGPEGWEVGLPIIETAVRAHGGAALVAVRTTGCNWWQSAALVTPEKTHMHTATHGRGIDTGESLSPVFATEAGNVGIVLGDEGLVPEVGRCLALEGADILAWALFEPNPMAERLARTRSDENRVYTAVAWPGGGLVSNPDGALLTAVPAGSGIAMTASVQLALSRSKERAPGTNVIQGRIPEAYAALTRQPRRR
jgi:predicted amidohydrolase